MDKELLISQLNSSKDKYLLEYKDYLNSLIELENSVVSSKYLTDDDRKILKRYKLYDDIKTYNIYYKTLKTLDDNNIDYKIISDDIEKIDIINRNKNKRVLLFNSDFSKVKGELNLYEYYFNRRERIRELDRVVERLNELYSETNPYIGRKLRENWDMNHLTQIYNLEKIYKRLCDFKITDEHIYKMELSNYVTKLLLNDYDLKYQNFNHVLPKTKNDFLIKKLQLKKEDMNVVRNIVYL